MVQSAPLLRGQYQYWPLPGTHRSLASLGLDSHRCPHGLAQPGQILARQHHVKIADALLLTWDKAIEEPLTTGEEGRISRDIQGELVQGLGALILDHQFMQEGKVVLLLGQADLVSNVGADGYQVGCIRRLCTGFLWEGLVPRALVGQIAPQVESALTRQSLSPRASGHCRNARFPSCHSGVGLTRPCCARTVSGQRSVGHGGHGCGEVLATCVHHPAETLLENLLARVLAGLVLALGLPGRHLLGDLDNALGLDVVSRRLSNFPGPRLVPPTWMPTRPGASQ